VADTRVVIPDRDLFKASEVCEIASVQPYVLRSWEQEFPAMGTSRSPGAPRIYRRADVELVLRVKGLVFVDGMTLAGARRQIEDEDDPVGPVPVTPAVGAETREKLAGIKQELRELLELLGGAPEGAQHGGWPPTAQSGVLGFEGDSSRVASVEGGARKGLSRKKKRPAVPEGE
jgi:DNA-binding transcriptional MerR regulator